MKRSFLERSDKSSLYIEEELFGSKTAGILLSGEHYSIKNPLLYYSQNILFENKIDYYGFDFLYTSNKKYLNSSYEERIKIINEEALS